MQLPFLCLETAFYHAEIHSQEAFMLRKPDVWRMPSFLNGHFSGPWQFVEYVGHLCWLTFGSSPCCHTADVCSGMITSDLAYWFSSRSDTIAPCFDRNARVSELLSLESKWVRPVNLHRIT